MLKVDAGGSRDNFFALGGDSLAMAVMMSIVEERFGRSIPIDRFLTSPTIETLARSLHGSRRPRPTRLPARDGSGKAHQRFHPRRLEESIFQCLALYAPGYTTTRVWLHRMRGVTIGDNVSIGLSAMIETAYPKLVSLGNNVSIGMRVVIIAHLRDSYGAGQGRAPSDGAHRG